MARLIVVVPRAHGSHFILDRTLAIAGVRMVREKRQKRGAVAALQLLEESSQLDWIPAGLRHQVRSHRVGLALITAGEAIHSDEDSRLGQSSQQPVARQ